MTLEIACAASAQNTVIGIRLKMLRFSFAATTGSEEAYRRSAVPLIAESSMSESGNMLMSIVQPWKTP